MSTTIIEDASLNLEGLAVFPSKDCPHLVPCIESRSSPVPSYVEFCNMRPTSSSTAASSSSSIYLSDLPLLCHVCQDSSENWSCLGCDKILCSRYVAGHMAEHATRANVDEKHVIAKSFVDQSFWCFACDSYIDFDAIYNAYKRWRQKSQQPDSGVEVQSGNGGDKNDDNKNNNNNCSHPDPERELLENVHEDRSHVPAPSLRRKTKLSHAGDIGDNMKQIAELIQKSSNIIMLTGAGVSTAAGVPDFRSPGTGLYDNLAKYNLPHPMAVFEISYFRSNPEPFYQLAKELYPGDIKPTYAHRFIRLLQEKGKLLRLYTQNIDGLDRDAGIRNENIVEVHGSFSTASCIDCHKSASIEQVRETMFADQIPRCTYCGQLVKPDIVFFGEALPPLFYSKIRGDARKCDLLIVMGTSLVVMPVGAVPEMIDESAPRVLINRDIAGDIGERAHDVVSLEDIEEQILMLGELCGWDEELHSLE